MKERILKYQVNLEGVVIFYIEPKCGRALLYSNNTPFPIDLKSPHFITSDDFTEKKDAHLLLLGLKMLLG